jgi:hypothetical protein
MGAAASAAGVSEGLALPLDASDVDTPRGESAKAEVSQTLSTMGLRNWEKHCMEEYPRPKVRAEAGHALRTLTDSTGSTSGALVQRPDSRGPRVLLHARHSFLTDLDARAF